MHYLAFVLIDRDGDIDAQVEALMAPHREVFEGDESRGFWDFYQVGARWCGLLDGYEPDKDRHNMKQCWLCHGTGKRTDEVARTNAMTGCNGCDGCDSTGIKIKWPTQWRRHDGDIQPAAWVAAPGELPYTLVTSSGSVSREVWDGKGFAKTPDFETTVRRALQEHDGRAVVVDYHS